MDVRAFSEVLPVSTDPAGDQAHQSQLRTMRLERLSPSVMIALFEGVPQLVWCEEPHHGIQFGVLEVEDQFFVVRRDSEGNLIQGSAEIRVPVRESNGRVLGIKALRDRFATLRAAEEPSMVEQNGSANFAVAILNRPWRQRFQQQGGTHVPLQGPGSFVPAIMVAPRVTQLDLRTLLLEAMQ
jgi:hypothetical protein